MPKRRLDQTGILLIVVFLLSLWVSKALVLIHFLEQSVNPCLLFCISNLACKLPFYNLVPFLFQHDLLFDLYLKQELIWALTKITRDYDAIHVTLEFWSFVINI